jgi:hypothetical protein
MGQSRVVASNWRPRYSHCSWAGSEEEYEEAEWEDVEEDEEESGEDD